MFAFVAEGDVVSLIVRELANGSEQLTVGVKSDGDVLWATARSFSYDGELPEGGKLAAVTVAGAQVRIGAKVRVSGAIAFYTPKGDSKARNKAFNLTKVSVLESSDESVERLVEGLAF